MKRLTLPLDVAVSDDLVHCDEACILNSGDGTNTFCGGTVLRVDSEGSLRCDWCVETATVKL